MLLVQRKGLFPHPRVVEEGFLEEVTFLKDGKNLTR